MSSPLTPFYERCYMRRFIVTIIFIFLILVPSLSSARDAWQISFFDGKNIWEFAFNRYNFDNPNGIIAGWTKISNDSDSILHMYAIDLPNKRWSLSNSAWMEINPESAIGRLTTLLIEVQPKLSKELEDEKNGMEEIYFIGPIPTGWLTGNPFTWFFLGDNAYESAFSEFVGMRDKK